MVSNEDVAEAFVEHRKKSAGHIFTDGRIIYGYGYHFPIAVWQNSKFGFPQVLINTDKYSRSTSSHQSRVINALAKLPHLYTNEGNTQQLQDYIATIPHKSEIKDIEKEQEKEQTFKETLGEYFKQKRQKA